MLDNEKYNRIKASMQSYIDNAPKMSASEILDNIVESKNNFERIRGDGNLSADQVSELIVMLMRMDRAAVARGKEFAPAEIQAGIVEHHKKHRTFYTDTLKGMPPYSTETVH